MNKNAFYCGVNLGGWISQYPSYSHDHFQKFILEIDIQRIADWGMDHVRLPFDYPILESDAEPGNYIESGFDYIESCLEWCQRNNLRVILDMHKAPGYSFDDLQASSMFNDTALKERYKQMWETITQRFVQRYPDRLAFELLNEVVLPNSDPWNELAALTLKRIRALDANRLVVVGGNHYNMPDQLQYLQLPQDDHLLYTFHFYEPFLVTHQRAPWIPFMVRLGKNVEYPGGPLAIETALQPGDDPLIGLVLENETGVALDKNLIKSGLQPAFEFIQKTGHPLYCGEFGIIDIASQLTRLNWTRDMIELLQEYHIGRAYWSYKATDFGLVDQNGAVVSQELIDILTHS